MEKIEKTLSLLFHNLINHINFEAFKGFSPKDKISLSKADFKQSLNLPLEQDYQKIYPKLEAPPTILPILEEIQIPETSKLSSKEVCDFPSPFFDKHISKGERQIIIGSNCVIFNEDGIGKIDLNELIENDYVLKLALELAKKYNITIGFWGGTSRDLLLSKKRSITSDIDLIYDSREENFKEFKAELIKQIREKLGNSAPLIDFSVDKNPEIYMKGPYRGLTIEKLALMSNGTIYDFTGKGLEDLSKGILRYNSSEPFVPLGISSIFRMIKTNIQNPQMQFNPLTEIFIKETLQKYYAPDSENIKKIKAFKKVSSLIKAKSLYEFLKKQILQGALSNKVLKTILKKGGKHIFEGRKEHGENYLDFSSTLRKIVKIGLKSNPLKTLEILRKYGLVDFLSSIEDLESIKPLIEYANSKLEFNFNEIISKLNSEAQIENIKLALSFYSDKLKYQGKINLAKRIEKIANSFSYSKNYITKHPFKIVEEILKSFIENGEINEDDLEKTLQNIFFKSRNNEKFSELFEVKRLTFDPLVFSSNPPKIVQSGFDPEITSIDLSKPHSMKDVEKYLKTRIGEFIIKDITKNKRIVEIHSGSKEEALASLTSRGFKNFARITAPRASLLNQIYLTQRDTGEFRYIFTEIYGNDRITHTQLLLYYASCEDVHLNSKQVEIYRDPVRDKIDAYRRYAKVLLKSGIVPSKVILGFKNGIIKELQERQEVIEKLTYLKNFLAEQPYFSLIEKLCLEEITLPEEEKNILRDLINTLKGRTDFEELLKFQTQDVFSSFQRIERVRELEKLLSLALEKIPHSLVLSSLIKDGKIPYSQKNLVKPVGDYYSDQGLITYVDANGKKKVLLLIRTPYGDASGDLGGALSDYGVKEVILTGTAGGLRKDSAVGEINLPDKIASGEGIIEIRNALLDFIKSESRFKDLRLNASAASVNSPLEETEELIKSLKQKGYDLVEMEVSDLIKSLIKDKSPMNFSAAQIISDLPGGEKTLEGAFSPKEALEKSLRILVDTLIDYIKISKIEYQEEETLDDLANFKNASSLAANLIKKQDGEIKDQELMHYNLSRYLINGATKEALSCLAKNFKGSYLELKEEKMISSRWLDKINRTFESPYTNSQVFLNLNLLATKLKRLIKFIQANNLKKSKYKIYLMGSTCKGRIAFTSDMDVLVKTEDKELMEKVINSEFGYKGAKDPQFIAGEFEYAANRLDFYKPAISVGDGLQILEDQKFVEKFYIDILRKYGIIIEKDKEKIKVNLDQEKAAQVAKREVPLAAEKILEYEKRYRKFMNTDFVLKYLKMEEQIQELACIPLARLIEIGENLAQGYLSHHFTPQAFQEFLKTPQGKNFLEICQKNKIDPLNILELIKQGKGEDFFSLIPMENIPEIIKLKDPVECLALMYAGAERLRNSNLKLGNPFKVELMKGALKW